MHHRTLDLCCPIPSLFVPSYLTEIGVGVNSFHAQKLTPHGEILGAKTKWMWGWFMAHGEGES